jgi:hypothetical protein
MRLVANSPSARPSDATRSRVAARSWRGPAILSHGFRPFFLSAGVWALVGLALWLLAFRGAIEVPTAFSTVDWHAHEMIFGYVGAVMAGFLLTAIPNWTGRLPVSGARLARLVTVWAAGRVAVYISVEIGRIAAGAIDAAFLFVFAATVAAEVISGRNARNAKIVALVAALAIVNIAFHVEDARTGLAEYSTRAALGLIVMVILLIGGRVTPSWPAPFGRADGIVLVGSGLALTVWTVAPGAAPPRRESLEAVSLAGAGRAARRPRPGVARRLFVCGSGLPGRRGRRPLVRTNPLCGRRACLGDRGHWRDDARDDDPSDAGPQRTRADRVSRDPVRLRLSHRGAPRPPGDGVHACARSAVDGYRSRRLDWRIRGVSDRLWSDACSPNPSDGRFDWRSGQAVKTVQNKEEAFAESPIATVRAPGLAGRGLILPPGATGFCA